MATVKGMVWCCSSRSSGIFEEMHLNVSIANFQRPKSSRHTAITVRNAWGGSQTKLFL